MPGRLDIMDAIREGLDAIHFAPNVGFAEWTRAVTAKLCEVGQNRFRCYVCTNQNHAPMAECSGWLYDMTWLEYTSHRVGKIQTCGWLIGAHLVAECEWSARNRSIGEIEDDFTKLLLAGASVRLMICYEWGEWNPEKDIHGGTHGAIRNAGDLADHLVEWVRRFNDTRAEDACLLAVLGWDDGSGAFRFKYFKLGLSGAIAWT